MASSETRDRRLTERAMRRGSANTSIIEPSADETPDLADNAEFPSDESVVQLADELRAEKAARDLCIERSLAEPAAAEPRITAPPIPIDIE